jgi:predicted nucleotide-binding protein
MKKYQVFISSTYADLIEERKEIIKALLELNCIPVGMEVFPDSGESSYDYTKMAIAESDYYILLIGNRYGSIASNVGKSFTELEYEYAIALNKPVLAFIKQKPEKLSGKHIEISNDEKNKLEGFRKEILNTTLVKFFDSTSELGRSVSSSVISLMRNYPTGGWVKESDVTKETNELVSSHDNDYKEMKDEFYRLNKKIDDLIFIQKKEEESRHPVGDKVRVFIGSSFEGLEVARCIQAELAYDYEVEIWNQGTVFGLGDSTLEALEHGVRNYDIGIFIFTPDDELVTRGENKPVARDNVIFELGLFIGQLTRFRAFIVHPSGKVISLPSDLAGITTATYNPALTNLRASLGPACHAIRDAIRRIKSNT